MSYCHLGAKAYALATSLQSSHRCVSGNDADDALKDISSGMCAYVQILLLYKLFLLFDRIWVKTHDSHLVRLERFFI